MPNTTRRSLITLSHQQSSKTPTEKSTEKYIILRKNTPDKRIHNPSHEKETENTAPESRGEGGVMHLSEKKAPIA